MPTTALKHLAKKANVSIDRAEHLWDKAKGIVDKEYGKDHKGYWGLVMGITKKMLGEGTISFKEFMLAEGSRDGFWQKVYDHMEAKGIEPSSDKDKLAQQLIATAKKSSEFQRVYGLRQHQAEKDARVFAERETAEA